MLAFQLSEEITKNQQLDQALKEARRRQIAAELALAATARANAAQGIVKTSFEGVVQGLRGALVDAAVPLPPPEVPGMSSPRIRVQEAKRDVAPYDAIVLRLQSSLQHAELSQEPPFTAVAVTCLPHSLCVS